MGSLNESICNNEVKHANGKEFCKDLMRCKVKVEHTVNNGGDENSKRRRMCPLPLEVGTRAQCKWRDLQLHPVKVIERRRIPYGGPNDYEYYVHYTEFCYGFQPLAPHCIYVAFPAPDVFHQQKDEDSFFYLQNWTKLHTKVQDILQQTQGKFRYLMTDIEYLTLSKLVVVFWLHLDNQTFQNKQHHKLKPIRYGLCHSLSSWVQCFSLIRFPAQRSILYVVNVSQLKLYERSQSEEEVSFTHQDVIIRGFQQPFAEDVLLDVQTHTNCKKQMTTYLVGRKGTLLT